ncbi:uncharacterized protein LOC127006924 isoform X2 [Eriocheir sinensis]|uniref:uncharacterized protein LOC127006924 isoform X2 n=1 Tax=Eriocheir sinensis TaxID=95602 RepID=UPI0021C62513|nr:uncharacterized protein LOC127006924 isoform X2 [Eriocheir sinensis]
MPARERSPSTMPLSPSHPASREKSPNPSSHHHDLHDCSMCLSAYLQSLNTVCGTACRLSQCLAQSCGDEAGPGLVREVAEAWEGVARSVGVASASVKNQMLVLVQEAQSTRQDPMASQADRRADLQRVVMMMLSAFLGLQQQFSVAVLERFSGVVAALREEGLKQGSSHPSDLPAQGQHLLGPVAARESPSLEDKTPGRPPSAGTSRPQTAWVGPASPGASNLTPGNCQTLAPGSAWPPDAISRRWSMVDGWATLGNFSLLASRRWSVPEADGEGGTASGAGPWGGLTPTSRDSSVTRSPTHSRSTTPDPKGQGSFISNEELQDVIDLLSIPLSDPPAPGKGGDGGVGRPSFDGGGGGGGGVIGRNSFDGGVGGARNSIDSSGRNSFDSGLGGRNSFDIGSGSRNSFDGGGGARNSFDGGGGAARNSFDGGGSGGRNSFDAGGTGGPRNSFDGGGGGGTGGGGGISPVGLSPTHHHHHQNPLQHPSIAQLFEEATKQHQQQQPQPPIKPPQSPQQQLPYHHHQQHPHQHHTQLHHHQPQQPFTARRSIGEIVPETPDRSSQVSTPLWPPSGIAPGVTLTECPGASGDQDSPLPLWTEGVGCERRGGGGGQARDSAHRASWPAAAPPPSLMWAGLEGLTGGSDRLGGAEEDGLASSISPACSPQYRRHSTDTTHLAPHHPHHLTGTPTTTASAAAAAIATTAPASIPKTRSSDNIAQVRAGGGGCHGGGAQASTGGSCLDNNLQHLLLLNSLLPASSPPSPTSQYSLFTS